MSDQSTIGGIKFGFFIGVGIGIPYLLVLVFSFAYSEYWVSSMERKIEQAELEHSESNNLTSASDPVEDISRAFAEDVRSLAEAFKDLDKQVQDLSNEVAELKEK